MQNIKFFNSVLTLLFVFFVSSCSKEMPTIAPSDSSVSIENAKVASKTWNGNDDDDWMIDLIVRDHTGSPVGFALGVLTDENGEQYMSLTNSNGLGSLETINDAIFQYISVTQAGSVKEIESAVQNGNTIDVQLK